MVVDEVMQSDRPALEGAIGKDGVQEQLYGGDPVPDGHGLYVAVDGEILPEFRKLRIDGCIRPELRRDDALAALG